MTDKIAAKTSPWAPLREPVFRNIWIAATFSNVGTWMQNVGGVWLMTMLTTSPVMVALMQTATSLPVFLAVIPAAAIADIVDRRRMLLFTQTWMFAAALGLSIITYSGWITPALLLAFTFALGIGSAVNMPVWQTVVPRLVPKSQLPTAVALNSVSFNLARAVGPAVGGVLIALWGSESVFLLNALSFVGVILVLLFWRPAALKRDLPPEHVVGAIRAGFRYARNAPQLKAVLMRCTVFIFFGSALMTLMPLVAKHELGMEATGFGGLLACLGIGALIGAMILPGLRNRGSIDQITAIGTVVFALSIVGLAVIRSVDQLYLLMTIGGVSWITVMASFTVAAQTSVPAWVQSRALGFYTLAFQGSWAISSAGWGFTASAVGNRTALLLAAVGLIVSLLVTLRRPLAHLIELDLRPSMHWPEPVVTLEPQPEDGPVLILVEYDIDPEKADGFIAEIHELARIRRRDGAIRWGIHRDLSDPRHFVEHFVVGSWAEHLRQHMRGAVADREVEKRVFAYHTGPEHPKVSHLIEQ